MHEQVSVYDRDAFSPLELFKFNFKDVLESKEFLGRCLINVLPITSREGQPYERWYDLGKVSFETVPGQVLDQRAPHHISGGSTIRAVV